MSREADGQVSAREEFGGLGDRAWLNCAHQAPLPDVAVAAAREALHDKRSPWRIADPDFAAVPDGLRHALARLIGAPGDEVVLANSTSYGLELLARTLPWRRGDEVLLVDGEFPATIYPWLPLRERGVTVRLLRPKGQAPTPEELAAELSPATRLFCSSWVFSFTGAAVDLDGLGAICRERGVWFVVNGSQAVGARPIDVRATPIDALVSAGFKWLCGPYATGFAWIRSELRKALTYAPAYWLTHQLARPGGLERRPEYELEDVGARAYDVFCTANFLTFRPWTASIELLLEWGVERVAAIDQRLVGRLLAGLEGSPLTVLSPREEPDRSTLVFVSHERESENERLQARLQKAGVDVALRSGALRLSPHFYNDERDVDRALEALVG
jgi:cysteine desulfurase / selenocysteine lyase